MQIAIDGPSGAGKSTIAKELANKLNIEYLDTGSMYRALGYKLKDVDLSDISTLEEKLKGTDLDIIDGNIFLDGADVEDIIRSEEAAAYASNISDNILVREYLVNLQREIGSNKSIIMDGRDIGGVVLPNADYKFYLTADPKVRAERRYRELIDRGIETTLEDVLDDILKRDYMDSTREHSPLKKSKDAIEIDASYTDIEETVSKLLGYIEV